jgi:hypothetical protein
MIRKNGWSPPFLTPAKNLIYIGESMTGHPILAPLPNAPTIEQLEALNTLNEEPHVTGKVYHLIKLDAPCIKPGCAKFSVAGFELSGESQDGKVILLPLCWDHALDLLAMVDAGRDRLQWPPS